MSTEIQLNDDMLQLCTFTVAGRTYAVDVLAVREVNPDIVLTPVPHTVGTVRGLVNVRGQVFLILDLQQSIRGVAAELLSTTRLVLFKERVGTAFGILVDRVGDIITIRPDQVLDMSAGEDDVSEGPDSELPALGVVKLEEHLVIVLDPARIIGLARQPRPPLKSAS